MDTRDETHFSIKRVEMELDAKLYKYVNIKRKRSERK